MVTVDTVVLRGLVLEALSSGLSGTGIAVLVAADDDPEQGSGVSKWVRLVKLAYEQSPRQRGDNEVDTGACRFEVRCFVTSDRAEDFDHAVAEVMSNVAKVLDGACLRDAATTHQLDVAGVSRDEFPEDDQPIVTVGVVQCVGTALRVSGNSVVGLT